MRGKGILHPMHCPHGRITPAYAGKSKTFALPDFINQDHPRVCGEKFTFFVFCPYVLGSPPRMRGKAWHSALYVFHCGITPAYAGKSFASGYRSQILWDHPRVCGEKTTAGLYATPISGSPPRMRGKENRCGHANKSYGITPAYAGKRLKRSRSIVPHAAIVPLFPSVCNKPAGSDGSPAGHDAPPFLPIENAAPASPAYNLRSL